MALRCVVLGLSGALLASTAALAQYATPQDFRQQDFRQQDIRQLEPRVAQPAVQPYIPADQRGAGQAPQAFMPQDFRSSRQVQPAVGANAGTGWSEHRQQGEPAPVAQPPITQPPLAQRISAQPAPVYLPPDRQNAQPVPAAATEIRPSQPAPVYRTAPPKDRAVQERPATDARAPQQQDYRSPQARVAPGVQPIAAPGEQKFPVYEARPGVIDPRVVVPREEKYIDYKPIDGRPYDFRPVDFKPVDTRSMEYRSFDNKVQDQKVLDPRLKEKGPEIQARLECKAIMYRAVECNFLDYKEVDPRLQDLFNKYPEVTLGIVPKEYSKETMDRWAPLVAHLSREIGLKISLKIANDYQALIESQRAGLIHIAIYSPMAYARARHTGARVEAFAIESNPDGSKGSHAMLYAMVRGPAPKTEDFKGKSIGLVDPNSISGYSVPRFALAAQKIDPDTVLGKQVFTGSHENALVALSQGLVDYAVGQWSSDEDSTLGRLIARGALKNVDGTPMKRDDFRVVMKSDLIVNSPIAYLSELPDDLKAVIRRAVLEAPMRDRTAFDRIYDVKGRNWETIDTKVYEGTVDLIKFIDDTRKVQAAAGSKTASR